VQKCEQLKLFFWLSLHLRKARKGLVSFMDSL
jgi:hypothetical protein